MDAAVGRQARHNLAMQQQAIYLRAPPNVCLVTELSIHARPTKTEMVALVPCTSVDTSVKLRIYRRHTSPSTRVCQTSRSKQACNTVWSHPGFLGSMNRLRRECVKGPARTRLSLSQRTVVSLNGRLTTDPRGNYRQMTTGSENVRVCLTVGRALSSMNL